MKFYSEYSYYTGNIVVHFMMTEAREEYQLEKLWTLGGKYDDLLQEMIKIQKLIETERWNVVFDNNVYTCVCKLYM